MSRYRHLAAVAGLALLCLLCVDVGESIRCFRCAENECKDGVEKPQFCLATHKFCVKVMSNTTGKTPIKKGCVPAKGPNCVEDEVKAAELCFHYCESDLCNSSVAHDHHFGSLLLGLSVAFGLFLYHARYNETT